MREAVALIMAAERPVLYVGGGVIRANAAPEHVRDLAETGRLPVVTTLMARGAFPDDARARARHARHARELHGGHGDAAVATC